MCEGKKTSLAQKMVRVYVRGRQGGGKRGACDSTGVTGLSWSPAYIYIYERILHIQTGVKPVSFVGAIFMGFVIRVQAKTSNFSTCFSKKLETSFDFEFVFESVRKTQSTFISDS